MYSTSLISDPDKVIAKFMATLLGIGHVAPDSKSKLKIPEGDRKKMIEEGGIEKQEEVEILLNDLYKNLLRAKKRKSLGIKTRFKGDKKKEIFRNFFEITPENNPHKISTANEKQLFTSRLDQIKRLIISLRSKEERGEYTFMPGVDSQSLLDVCQLTANYWASIERQGLSGSEDLNHNNLSIWSRHESRRKSHVDNFKQFVNSIKTSNEDKGNGHKKELISDEDIIRYMESIIRFRSQNWWDKNPLVGIPEDDRPALEKDSLKRYRQVNKCREQFWVDVIRNDKETKLTDYLTSYMNESLKNNSEKDKYCLALDHEAIFSTLIPLKDADLARLDQGTRQIVNNLVFSAEKVNDQYKHCKELIQTNREIAQKSKNYEEFKVFAKNTEGEISALEDLFKGGVNLNEIELPVLQLSEKISVRPDSSLNEETQRPLPVNPGYHEVHPSAPRAPAFVDPFSGFENPQAGVSQIQPATAIPPLPCVIEYHPDGRVVAYPPGSVSTIGEAPPPYAP